MNQSVSHTPIVQNPMSHHAFQWMSIDPNYVKSSRNQPMHHPLSNQPAYLAQRQPTQQSPTNPNPAQKSGNQPQYPAVDSNLLYQSANVSQKLMADASKVLNTFASSRDFGRKVMEYAQRSDNEEVNQLIKSLGIESDVKVQFNPDGLRLEFKSKAQGLDCCVLYIALRWR